MAVQAWRLLGRTLRVDPGPTGLRLGLPVRHGRPQLLVVEADDRWLLRRPGLADVPVPRDEPVLPWLEAAAIDLVLGKVTGWARLHAAVLADQRGLVVLCGRSGAGKSTLALGLFRAGMRYLGDELALLSAQGLVRAWGRPLRLSTPVLPPEVRDWMGDLPVISEGRDVRVALPVGRRGGRLRTVVVLEPGNGPALEPLPAALAVARCWPETVGDPAAPRPLHQLELLSTVLARVPCWQLRTGQPADTLDVLVEMLRRAQ